jgi:fumarate reductase (CoM/CoB) subunit A
MCSAIAAAKNDVNVIMVCKSQVGKSGSSVVSKSVHRYCPNTDKKRAIYKEKLLEAGRYINDENLVDILIEKGSLSVESLAKLHSQLYFKEVTIDGKNYKYLAACKPKKGKYLTVPIMEFVRRQPNIKFLERYMAIQLVTNKDGVCGLLLEKQNKLYFISSKAIVMATGGGGYIYSHTSCTNDLTADGYAMALRTNITLRDMEFVQFYPYRIYHPFRHDIFPDIFKYGAKFVNNDGHRFMNKYKNAELENRDILAREMFYQEEVSLDLNDCDREFLKEECDELYDKYIKHKNERLKVRPVAHFMMGGISIKDDCSTDLKGLFCCGEVTSGVHGANRLAGHALTEIAVFAPIAGESAADFVKGKALKVVRPQIDWLPKIGDEKVFHITQNLREAMWNYVGIVKSEESLDKAKNILDELLYQLKIIQPRSIRKWIECLNMIEVSKIIVDVCDMRRESRGSHYRTDFTEERDCWLGNILIKNRHSVFVNK